MGITMLAELRRNEVSFRTTDAAVSDWLCASSLRISSAEAPQPNCGSENSGLFFFCTLERDARRQLDLPRPSSFGRLQSGERPESGNPHRQSLRRSEVRMVEQIGHLHSQLSANGLLDGDALDEGHRHRLSAWPNDIARRRVSEAADGVRRAHESSGIDPLADRLPRVRIDAGNRVCAAPGRVERVEAATTGIVERTDGHEWAALKQQHACELPSTHQPVHQTVGATQQHLPFTEWQVVKKRSQEAIPAGEVYIAVIDAGRVGIGNGAPILSGETARRRGWVSAQIGQIPRIDIAA